MAAGSRRPARDGRAARRGTLTGYRGARGAAVVAGLSARLTERDRWLLRMLHEHTVLTTSQLHRLGWATSLRRVQSRTRLLHDNDLIDRFRPLRLYGEGTSPWHLLLGPAGAEVVAGELDLTPREIGYPGRVRTASVAHRITLGHDLGVRDLVCSIAAAPGVALQAWWSPVRCSHAMFRVGAGFPARMFPDAYISLATAPPLGPGGWWEMVLEYDTGTETLGRVADKLAEYAASAQARKIQIPVGFWFTRPGREAGARRELLDAMRATRPGSLMVFTAAPQTGTWPGSAEIDTAGGRVWLPLHPEHDYRDRVSLADITASQRRPSRTLADCDVLTDKRPVPPAAPTPPVGAGRPAPAGRPGPG